MKRLAADFFDGLTSVKHSAEVTLNDDGTITLLRSENVHIYEIREVRISDRLTNIPRSIYFPDGGKCECIDNDAIDQYLHQHNQAGTTWLYDLESQRFVVVASCALTVVVMSLLVWVGIPALADRAARAIPTDVEVSISEEALQVMDSNVFTATKLDLTEQTRLSILLDQIVTQVEVEGTFRLELRSSNRIGANAFALPSGIVIVTDELVALAEDENELISILAHEVGHVVHRHSLRQVIQGSAIALLIGTVTGDVISVSTFSATIPALLVEGKYSRDFEIEADAFAAEYLRQQNISTQHFADILTRLDEADNTVDRAASFLDTHPSSEDRIMMLQGDPPYSEEPGDAQ